MTAASTPRDPRRSVIANMLFNWQHPDDICPASVGHGYADQRLRRECRETADAILSALAEAGWEVTRLEQVGVAIDDDWFTLDTIRGHMPFATPPGISVEPLYRKLEPQEETDG